MVKESELKECSYFLVRYVPDVTKEEFINIGVLLSCPGERFLDCAFSDDWRRINRFHEQADPEFLKDLQSHFKKQIEEHKSDPTATSARCYSPTRISFSCRRPAHA